MSHVTGPVPANAEHPLTPFAIIAAVAAIVYVLRRYVGEAR